MKKRVYSAPKMEQVRMEAEMPVMAGSGGGTGGSISGFTTSAGSLV